MKLTAPSHILLHRKDLGTLMESTGWDWKTSTCWPIRIITDSWLSWRTGATRRCTQSTAASAWSPRVNSTGCAWARTRATLGTPWSGTMGSNSQHWTETGTCIQVSKAGQLWKVSDVWHNVWHHLKKYRVGQKNYVNSVKITLLEDASNQWLKKPHWQGPLWAPTAVRNPKSITLTETHSSNFLFSSSLACDSAVRISVQVISE